MVEEIVYDEETKCEQVSYESCFNTFQSVMRKSQRKECKTQFEKTCELEYRDVPKPQVRFSFDRLLGSCYEIVFQEVEICNEKLTRDCDAEGDIVCSDENEFVCEKVFDTNEIVEDIPDCRLETEQACTNNDIGEEVQVQILYLQ